LKAEEFARLKHQVETRQTNVDKAFAMLDDFVRKHEEGQDSSIGSARKEAEEKVVLLERLMEEMSRLNASYREYVQVLEKKVGF
jgi:hypothetical protein